MSGTTGPRYMEPALEQAGLKKPFLGSHTFGSLRQVGRLAGMRPETTNGTPQAFRSQIDVYGHLIPGQKELGSTPWTASCQTQGLRFVNAAVD